MSPPFFSLLRRLIVHRHSMSILQDQDRKHIPVYAGGVARTSIPTMHLIQDRVLDVVVATCWCGSWTPSYLRELCALCRPPNTAVLCPRQFGGPMHSPSLRQCRAVPFLWLVKQPGSGFPQIRGTSQMEPVLGLTSVLRHFFFAWPGSGVPLSRDLKGALYKFLLKFY